MSYILNVKVCGCGNHSSRLACCEQAANLKNDNDSTDLTFQEASNLIGVSIELLHLLVTNVTRDFGVDSFSCNLNNIQLDFIYKSK